jgi:serine/threonine protein kinase
MDIPRLIDHFQILKELGRGGMGTVYLAHDMNLDRNVAIKVVNLDSVNNEREQKDRDLLAERLVREARISAALDHPGIVTILQVGLYGNRPYLVMQYVEGPTLEALLSAALPFDPMETARIIGETAAALDHAHELKIIHRDIKPANIMLAHGRTVKICDFGIARSAMLPQNTSTGLMGTPHFMSPEQLTYKQVDRQADQWALGIIAYRMLTGRLPFQSDELSILAAQIIYGPTPFPPEAFPSLQLKKVFERVLDKDPVRRFDTCSAFAADLAAALIWPTTLPTIKPVHENRAKRRWVWGGLSVVAIGAAFAGVVFDRDGRGSARQRARAETSKASVTAEERKQSDDVKTPHPTKSEPVHADFAKTDDRSETQVRKRRVEARTTVAAIPKSAIPKDTNPGKSAPLQGDKKSPTTGKQENAISTEDEIAAQTRQRRRRGEVSASNDLGRMYEDGSHGLRKDEANAVKFYKEAAIRGNVMAMANLGRMYEKGSGGLPRDGGMALKWYMNAANLGDSAAMFDVGRTYENGLGGPKDLRAAVFWYRKAAKFRDPAAVAALGRLGYTP